MTKLGSLIYLSVMKRIIALSMLLIYGISVSAVSLNLHFCGDYLNHISLGDDKHGKCCCDDKPVKDNCCEDVQVKFSVSQTHAFVDAIHAPESVKSYVVDFNKTEHLFSDFVGISSLYSEWDTGPPERSGSSSIFLRNNNLRI